MTEENIELTVEELNNIAGGRALTDAEQQDILWAAKKIKSISVTDSYAKKMLSHYADEYQEIYDKYMNLSSLIIPGVMLIGLAILSGGALVVFRKKRRA